MDAVFATLASLEDAGEALTRVSQWLRIDEDPGVPVRVAATVTEIRAAKVAGDTAVVLQARGFSPDEAAGIMGLNFLRVLATIWGS